MMRVISLIFFILFFRVVDVDAQSESDSNSFSLKLLEVDKNIVMSIDSIVNYHSKCEKNNYFWYLNIENKGDTIVYGVSIDNVERLNKFAKNRGNKKGIDKAVMINGKLVLVIDPYNNLSYRYVGCHVTVKDPDDLNPEEINFIRYPTWVFYKVLDKRPRFGYRNAIKCE